MKTAAKLTMLEWQARNGAPVLVHCTAGQSRSAAIAAVVLMRMREVSLRDAFASLKACHPIAFPNYGLWSLSLPSIDVCFVSKGRGAGARVGRDACQGGSARSAFCFCHMAGWPVGAWGDDRRRVATMLWIILLWCALVAQSVRRWQVRNA
jgi:hypothetical protein